MLTASLVLSITLLLFVAWLHQSQRQGWPQEESTLVDAEYRQSRRRRRDRIHALLGIAAVLIAVAGVAGTGELWRTRVWVGCWSVVILILLTVVVLAMLDGFRTHRYIQRKLPELRREMLAESEPED